MNPQGEKLVDKISRDRTHHVTMVVEDTYVDHNASALISTCDCFGIQDLRIIEEIHRYRLAKRMPQNPEKWVSLHYYSNYENNALQCIDALRKQGYAIIGTSTHNFDFTLDDYDIQKKSASFWKRKDMTIKNCP